MKQWVFSFHQSASLPAEQIGAKAAGLLRLRQNGFNVPDGFCISSSAYTKHLRTAGIEITANADTIRNVIMQAPLDPALAEQIETCFRSLSGPVAVRSSATAEDLPDHSFAGQYDTFLNVSSPGECLEAVKKCWASLWTERAVQYRRKNGIDSKQLKMAVIVQTLVKADCAGVIFTADPISGDTNTVVIESCPGLGDKLVSGAVSPDRFIFDKTTLALTSAEQADPASPPSLEQAVAADLARLAVRIEQSFGSPQDIEWAAKDGNIFFLQSRPITTEPKAKTFNERQVWTNMNTAEVVPDVVTPLTWSVIEKMLRPLFRSIWRMLGADLDDHTIAGLVAGRLYFNVNTGVATALHFPHFIQRKMGLDELLGGSINQELLSGRLKFEKQDLPDVKGSLWKFFFRIPETLCRFYRHRFSQSLRHLEMLRAGSEHLKGFDPAKLSDAQICDLVAQTIHQMEVWDLLFVGMALASYPLLRVFCKKKLSDDNGTIAHQLIRGQNGMEDVQAGFDLWNLAAAANRSDTIRGDILSGAGFHELAQAIASTPQGQQFLNDWDRFMDLHGHHCRGELELDNARWSQQPDYILALVKNYIKGMDTVNPVESWNALEDKRKDLMRQCLQKLRNPLDRFCFRRMVEKTRIGLVLRENWKSNVVRVLVQLRRLMLEMGRRLHAAGILNNADDIFFMTIDEIRPAADYPSASELRQAIERRRLEYEHNKKLSPPHIVAGIYQQDADAPQNITANVGELKGLTVCPGKAKGRARVILRADDNEQVLAGEIMVAPFTDPAWTPYFLTAAGIVMDQGGMLSHGSVVAREYGIPAVVNVGPATKIIKTGQWLELDADAGLVRILS